MTEKQFELIKEAIEIIKKREQRYQENKEFRVSLAYKNVIDIITCALEENEECLSQFNYFN